MSMDRADALRRWAESNGYARPVQRSMRPPSEPVRAATEKAKAEAREGAKRLKAAAAKDDFTVLDIETTGRTPWRGDLLCVGVGEKAYAPDEGRRLARKVMGAPGVVVCHTSYDLRWLALDGARLHPGLRFHDTRVMGWLLDGNKPLALDDLCERWLGYVPPKLIHKTAGQLMFSGADDVEYLLAEAPWDELAAYNESDLRSTGELYRALRAALEREGLWGLFERDEVPLSACILEMETSGLPFDAAACEALREHVAGEAEDLAASLHRDGGLPASFNLGSSKQVADYIFGSGDVRLKDRVPIDKEAPDLGIPDGFEVEKVGRLWAHGHWTAQGRKAVPAEAGFGASVHWKEAGRDRARPSTSSLSLVLKNPGDEWIGDLVLWRELTKLGGSFLARFPDYSSGGRLYGTINRTGTATGRFSASEPNLQQVPAHGNYGAHVRALFCGPMGVGDYSQLEQRIAAHLSGDANLVKAYRDGVDLYGLAASIAFGGEPSKDHPQRGLMKTGMLAIQYGAGAGKMAQLMIVDGHEDATPEQAKELVAKLEAVFPRFFAWREEVVERAAHDGYIETLAGRRRPLEFPPDWARMRRRRWFGSLTREEVSAGFAIERQAISTACQGGAADAVAGALRAIWNEMRGEARLLLQVHDEILVERLDGWDGGSLARFQECCEAGHAFDLDVPLAFEAHEVESWAEKSGGSARHVSSGFQKRVKEARSEGLQSRKASAVARRRREERAKA